MKKGDDDDAPENVDSLAVGISPFLSGKAVDSGV